MQDWEIIWYIKDDVHFLIERMNVGLGAVISKAPSYCKVVC